MWRNSWIIGLTPQETDKLRCLLIEWDPHTIALHWACSIIVSLVLAAHNRWLYMLCLATEKENIGTWSVRLDPKGDTKEINSLSTDKEYSRRNSEEPSGAGESFVLYPSTVNLARLLSLGMLFAAVCLRLVELKDAASASWSPWYDRAPYEVSNPIDHLPNLVQSE
jgi:hypothetical protein